MGFCKSTIFWAEKISVLLDPFCCDAKSYSLPAFSERWSSPKQTIATLFNTHHLTFFMCLTPRRSCKSWFPQEIFLHAGCVQASLFIELFPLSCVSLICSQAYVQTLSCCKKATSTLTKFRNTGNLARVLFLLGFPVWLVDQRSIDTHLNS